MINFLKKIFASSIQKDCLDKDFHDFIMSLLIKEPYGDYIKNREKKIEKAEKLIMAFDDEQIKKDIEAHDLGFKQSRSLREKRRLENDIGLISNSLEGLRKRNKILKKICPGEMFFMQTKLHSEIPFTKIGELKTAKITDELVGQLKEFKRKYSTVKFIFDGDPRYYHDFFEGLVDALPNYTRRDYVKYMDKNYHIKSLDIKFYYIKRNNYYYFFAELWSGLYLYVNCGYLEPIEE